MILIHLVVHSEKVGDSKLMNSSKRSKTKKKYNKIDNYFKNCFMAEWIKYSHCNLKVDGLITNF